jgi:F0F1-type ATP synthase gamma subunit
MTNEPRTGFNAMSSASCNVQWASEALTLALHGKELAIDYELTSAERHLTKALEMVAAAKAARAKRKDAA